MSIELANPEFLFSITIPIGHSMKLPIIAEHFIVRQGRLR
ncbi:hypothetical protein ALTERO38_80149 [Alteromonas sp. 38]|nr:hypothetical protein ALTERO38_80149 [Alteromonas sp. 38]